MARLADTLLSENGWAELTQPIVIDSHAVTDGYEPPPEVLRPDFERSEENLKDSH